MKIIICDNDRQTLGVIEKWIRNSYQDQRYPIVFFQSGKELIKGSKHFNENDSYIAFMNLKLEDESGTETAKELQKRIGNLAIIYISETLEYAEDFFDSDPVYFLLKPLDKTMLEKAFEKALIRLIKNKNQFLQVVCKREICRIFYDEISYIESDGRKVRIHCYLGMIECYEKINELEKRLQKEFIRCHKSFLVNLEYVRGIKGREINLLGGEKIPVSRAKNNMTRQRILDFFQQKYCKGGIVE
jgi:two-component system response regulator LytT